VRRGEARHVLQESDLGSPVSHLAQDASKLPEHAGLLTRKPRTVPRKRKIGAWEGSRSDLYIGDVISIDVAHVLKTELVAAKVRGIERSLHRLNVVGEQDLTARPLQREADETDSREELRTAKRTPKRDDS